MPENRNIDSPRLRQGSDFVGICLERVNACHAVTLRGWQSIENADHCAVGHNQMRFISFGHVDLELTNSLSIPVNANDVRNIDLHAVR